MPRTYYPTPMMKYGPMQKAGGAGVLASTTVIEDDFSGGAATINGRTPTPISNGNNWDTIVAMEVDGSGSCFVNATGTQRTGRIDAGSTVMTVEAIYVPAATPNNLTRTGIIIEYTDTDNWTCANLQKSSGGSWTLGIRERHTGGETVYDNTAMVSSNPDTDTLTLRAEISGTSVTVTVLEDGTTSTYASLNRSDTLTGLGWPNSVVAGQTTYTNFKVIV